MRRLLPYPLLAVALFVMWLLLSGYSRGQAVLAVCPKASDLADLIHGHDAGWVVEPGDVSGLQRLLARLGSTPGEVLAKHLNAWKAGHEYYDQHVLVESWMRLFDSLALP